jgi:hypothetical protein
MMTHSRVQIAVIDINDETVLPGSIVRLEIVVRGELGLARCPDEV